MKSAYAGMPEPAQQQMVLGTTQLTKKDLAHQIVDKIGQEFGYGTVLLILAVGACVVYKNKIRKFFKGEPDGK